MFNLLSIGGLIMLVIIACALIATFIIFERSLYYSNLKKKDILIFQHARAYAKVKQYDKAAMYCEAQNTPTGSVLAKVFKTRFMESEDAKEAVLAESSRQLPKLEHLLTSLGTIANISTLLGLLGTVTGNIEAFGVLGSAGSTGDPSMLAGAIAQALITTAAGLVISIPSIVFYNHFTNHVNKTVNNLENEITDLMLLIRGKESDV
ncbi:MAG: hypothetical protein BKP49_06000 [Treponema sp. CETP13]|nr:MAG: hypothetical protein BKP49_06000 [Treponema sp. CETP13]